MRKKQKSVLWLSLTLSLILLASMSVTAQELFLHYSFNEGQGGDVLDDSGNENHARMYNMDVSSWVDGKEDKFGTALAFDGSDDYVQSVGPFSELLDGDFTMSVWINIETGVNEWARTVAFNMNGKLMLNFPSFGIDNDGGVIGSQFIAKNVRDDQWHHCVAVRDGLSLLLYVDGELMADQASLSEAVPMDTITLGCRTLGSLDSHGNYTTGKLDELSVYAEALDIEQIRFIMENLGFALGNARNPDPADMADDVLRDINLLAWSPGKHAVTHNVYMGTVFDDVNDADIDSPLLVSLNRITNTYDLTGLLDFGETYYWRVDEVNNLNPESPWKGDVWSFTVEPFAYPIEDIIATASSSTPGQEPENTVNGSGLDGDLHSTVQADMWVTAVGEPTPAWIQYDFDKAYKLHEMLVWNYNGPLFLTVMGLKDVVVEYSSDGTNFVQIDSVNEFARASGLDDYTPSTIVALDGILAKSVKISASSNWSGGFSDQFGLSEVQFLQIAVNAREPSPDSGTADVDVDVTLGFRAGREAVTHDVHLSTNEQAVIDSNALVSTVTEAGYGPLSLDLGTTYYWKINEVNVAETPTTWQSDIWNFTTQEYFVVDGFEDYNDYQPDEIWSTWVDGYGDSSNGAIAGYPEPLDFLAGEHYMEATIVHGGNQSAPFLYDNTTADAHYSEISVNPGDLAVGSDWTVGSPETLVLWFHGDSDNAATEQMYVEVNDVKVLYPGDAADITRPIWKQWNVDLTALGIDLSNVTRMSIGFERTGGVGGSGMVFIDDILLYHSAPPVPLEEVWIEAEDADTIGALIQVIDDPAASGGKYIAVEPGNNSMNAPDLPDGVATWTFTVAGGTYKIRIRLTTEFDDGNYDSCWFRIQGAEINRNIHSSGWIRHNDARPRGGTWGWDDLHSSEDGNQAVHFTLVPGTYTLEWAYRENGLFLDAIQISNVVE